ncbi:TPM domain-containing protein [Nitratireductor basaltis]|uniref:TPM domain-containing protein n=1 Tax=Nitratireductor basaltis TaxID=472175 RepID=A0A084U6J9_9HYPH|nr:TPM domain-containing protein [Nitratireductor basaltis]KFB08585.1 hypothetical protein EL18_02838 [Nitratireductor basaltis]
MAGKFLNDAEHERIRNAITNAEARTSGEIHCVLAQRSDSYFLPAAFFLTMAIIGLSLIAAIVLHLYWLALPLYQFVLAQAASVATGLLVLHFRPGIRVHLVPRSLRYRRAHENARRQFVGRNIHLTRQRTGVLIFLSLEEHYGEVLADSGIANVVPQARWNETVAKLIEEASCGNLAEAFNAAIAMVGEELARHFPPTVDDQNELSDHLAEI